MDAHRFGAAGIIVDNGAETATALGRLGRRNNDPLSLRRPRRTYRQSGKTRVQRADCRLHRADNFCRPGFCSPDRRQPAKLTGDWLLFHVNQERASVARGKGACPYAPNFARRKKGTGTFFRYLAEYSRVTQKRSQSPSPEKKDLLTSPGTGSFSALITNAPLLPGEKVPVPMLRILLAEKRGQAPFFDT